MRPCASITLAILVALSGCGNSEPGGQVIAVADGEEITLGELNEEARARGISIANNPIARASVVQDLVARKLLVQEARQKKLDRTPQHLLAVRRVKELLLVRELVGAGGVPAEPTNAEVASFISTNPWSFAQRVLMDVTQVAVPQSFQTSLGAARSLEDVEAMLAKAHVRAQRSTSTWDSAQLPPDTTRRLIASNGELLLLPQSGQTLAVKVEAVKPAPVPADQQFAIARELVRQQKADKAVQTTVDRAKSKARIDYQPGFAPAT